MTLGVIVAIWKRPRLTRMMLEYTASLVPGLADQGIDLRLRVVGSEGRRSERLAKATGWSYVEAPNMPLSDKYNAGVASVSFMQDLDGIIILGSDDFATPEMYLEAARLLEAGAVYVIPNGLHFLCTLSRRTIYLGSHNVGTFRVLRSDLLDELEWRPYMKGALSGIDKTMDDRVRAALCTDRYTSTGPMRLINTNPGFEEGRYLLDVKSRDNLWSFERMASSITSRFVEPDFLEAFGKDRARALMDFEPWYRSGGWRRLMQLDRSIIP